MSGWKLRDLSISQKLIALIAILMTLVVGVLTAYFPLRQIAELTSALVGRADIYGALFSNQLEPAIAFRDRETAREVLSSLALDPDVHAAALCTSDGRILHATGAAPAIVCDGLRETDARRVMVSADLVTVLAPVVSKEGPRGTLIIELSTTRLRSGRHLVTITAVTLGGLVLSGGVLAAWLIARSISRRLRRIADVASAVTAGELEHEPVVDPSPDELGTLARAFNAMLAQLRHLIADVKEMARREQETLAQANRLLEARVVERTAELSRTNAQLTSEMAQRSKIEVELRQAQKLESVGRLAAGVAHEINTPIQFVSDSVHFVRDAMKDLAPVVEKLQSVCRSVVDGSPSPSAAAEAYEAVEGADLPYLFENASPALDRALEGLGRVATIVRSMKEFAHPGQSEKASVDLNHAIESTLTISRHEYKLVADVETRFGDVPRVVCYANEVNQAVLNIIVNAAHAIGDAVTGTGRRGRITVSTRREEDDVVISIADTGGGIPEGIRERIFDPFFTTKEVGRGTGQGLAISRSVIVDKHGGELRFETAIGEGTTFYIRLPIEGASTPRAAEESAA